MDCLLTSLEAALLTNDKIKMNISNNHFDKTSLKKQLHDTMEFSTIKRLFSHWDIKECFLHGMCPRYSLYSVSDQREIKNIGE